MSPVEWLCSVVETLNARTSKQRFLVRSTTPGSCKIENLETGEVWDFQATVVNEPKICCAAKGFGYVNHSFDCATRRR